MKIASLFRIFPLVVATLGISHASPIPDFPFIMADGRVERDVPPTNVKVSFTVLAFSKTAEDATNSVQTTLTKTIVALKAEGVTENMILAHDLDKSAARKRTDQTYSDTDIIGYEVSRKVEIKLTDLSNFSKVVGILMATDQISQIKSVFDTDKRDEVEAELMEEACSKALKKAELLAKGAGVTIDRVFAVNDQTWRDLENLLDPTIYVSDGRGLALGGPSDSETDAEQAPLFAPSKITLHAKVNILYKLAP
jgi:uncharacterized protein YggE